MNTDTIEPTTNLEPFTSAGQSPGGVPSGGLPARLIAAVLALDYLEENPDALNPRNFENVQPLAAMAKTLDEFVKRYGRVPTTKEYDDIYDDAVKALAGVEVVKEAYRGLLDQVTEYATEWGAEDFSESERRVIVDRVNRETAFKQARQAIIEAADALDRGDFDAARGAMAKAQPTATNDSASYLINAADQWDFPAIEWYVNGIIPRRGLTFIGGQAKLGKSLLASTIAYAIACGRPYVFGPEFTIAGGARILYITEEEDGSIIQDRRTDLLRVYGRRVVPNDRLMFQTKGAGVDILEDAWLRRLETICRSQDRRLLILDTYEAVTPSADPKKIEHHKRALNSLIKLAAAIEGSVVVIDHAKLANPEDKRLLSHLDLAWSSAKGQKADHFMMLGPTNDPARFEVFLGGRMTPETRRFILTRAPKGSTVEKYRFAGSFDPLRARATERIEADQDAVRGVLEQARFAPDDREGWRTRQDIEAALNWGRERTRRVLRSMADALDTQGASNSENRAYRMLAQGSPEQAEQATPGEENRS